MDDHYRYKNSTYSKSFGEKLSGGRDIAGVPAAYPVLAILGVVVAFRRLR